MAQISSWGGYKCNLKKKKKMLPLFLPGPVLLSSRIFSLSNFVLHWSDIFCVWTGVLAQHDVSDCLPPTILSGLRIRITGRIFNNFNVFKWSATTWPQQDHNVFEIHKGCLLSVVFFFCQVLFLSKQLEGTLHMLLAEMQMGVGIFNFEGDSAGLILIVDSQSLRMKSVCAVFFMSGNAISWLWS